MTAPSAADLAATVRASLIPNGSDFIVARAALDALLARCQELEREVELANFDGHYDRAVAAEARVAELEQALQRERSAWAGIERKASNLRHRLDALEDAARRRSHGDHDYDGDVQRNDCVLCAAIEGRYQPAWMEEPHEWMRDPVVRAALQSGGTLTERGQADHLLPIPSGRPTGTGADHENAGAGSLDKAASSGKPDPRSVNVQSGGSEG